VAGKSRQSCPLLGDQVKPFATLIAVRLAISGNAPVLVAG
jgi:hypothetical protein